MYDICSMLTKKQRNLLLFINKKKFFLNVINKYRATVIEKKVCLQKRICHKLAPSKDFTMMPPKLKHSAPSRIKIVPGILFNSVNLSL